ncbi:MAG: hypothetical protein LBP96_04490 [Bacteroidales bacterium]|nr:hypothetical protein [Bacteroidales bacterium]
MKNIFKLGLWFCPLIGFAQQGGIGRWSEHYAYNHVKSILVLNNEICGITENGLFYYDKEKNSVRRKTTIQGLSGVGLSASNYDPATQTQIVGYQNGNIDLIRNGRVLNIPDLQRWQTSGSKQINKIVIENSRKVYLCCDFGIVMLNLERQEISETYFIGTNNSNVQVLDLTVGDSVIYAATNVGLMSANRFSNRLNDFSEWREITVSSQNGRFLESVNVWNNNLIVHQRLTQGNTIYDTIWRRDFQNQWHVLDAEPTRQIKVSKNRLFQLRKIPNEEWLFEIREYGSDFQILREYGNKAQEMELWGMVDIEADSENNLWLSTGYSGLTRLTPDWGYNGEILPQGPNSNMVFSLTHSLSKLYVAEGSMTGSWAPGGWGFNVNIFENDRWQVFNNQTIRSPHWLADAVAVAEDPRNPDVFVTASYYSGAVQSNADGTTTIYVDDPNCTLEWYYWIENVPHSIRCTDVKFDKKNQLWITNIFVENQLHKRTIDGKWTSYQVNVLPNDPKNFIVDYYNQLWITARDGGLVFFRETATGVDALVANLRRGNDRQISALNCLVEDKRGFVWLGTDRGILVNYTSRELFDKPIGSESTVEFKTINYEEVKGQGGLPLLGNENVTAIVVDGADRKWIGTSSSGVFLMSADGKEKIHQFNTENSPLNSNTITALAINPRTGVVYIGTDKGLMSFGGDATSASRREQKIVIFPNPVQADFAGEICISGLAENAKVHITDAGGILVFETIAKGGMATWNGKTRNGQRVKPGVYIVFSALADEEEGVLASGVGKIFINK